MKKLVLAASVALLAACSAPQQPQLNLMPETTLSTNPIVQGKSYSPVSYTHLTLPTTPVV